MKKKIIVGLLILGLLAGSVASKFIGFGLRADPSDADPFEGVPEPVIRSNKWQDFCSMDLSQTDFSNDGHIIHTFSFDSRTVWPEKEKMPPVTPEEIMEQGKYLGMGLSELHQKGITGDNISVAVIGNPIAPEHVDNPEKITYISIEEESDNFGVTNNYGYAVASIFTGVNGVAPGAHLYYFAVPDNQQTYAGYAKAVEKLLEVQETLEEKNKIKVVSISYPIDPWAKGEEAQKCLDVIERATEQGIIVVYHGMPDLELAGAGCPPGLDRDDPGNYKIWSKLQARDEIIDELKAAAPGLWDECRAELIRLLTEYAELNEMQVAFIYALIYSLGNYRGYIEFEYWFDLVTDKTVFGVAFPVDFLTVPGPAGNIYYGSGDVGWTAPYIAGLITLGLQVNPEATFEQMTGLLWDTGFHISQTARLVNPTGFIDELLAR